MTTGENTTYYYLGDRLVAKRTGTTLNYIHQDHLGGTNLMTNSNGSTTGQMRYYPYGERLNSQGNLGTDKLFTGQRLDDTGLYYYGARYYDPQIGRFISPDTIVQNPSNPQTLNRYSYVLNNPLKYVDPSGLNVEIGGTDVSDLDVIADQIEQLEAEGAEIPDSLLDQFLQLTQDWGEEEHGTWHEWEEYARGNPVARAFEESDFTFGWGGLGGNAWTGNSAVFTYSTSLGPASIYLVSDTSYIGRALKNVGGISVAPFGAFVRSSAYPDAYDVPRAAVHEATHFAEQQAFNLFWYAGYGVEIGAQSLYYGGNFWYGAYAANSFERRANSAAGWQNTKPNNPWWYGLGVNVSGWLGGLSH